jgi:cyanate lyase
MGRNAVTEKIIAEKVRRGLGWAEIAERVGRSKEWVTAA